MVVKNVPTVTIEGVKIYDISKVNSDKDVYRIETKLIAHVDDEDPLLNDVRRAFVVVKTPILKSAFSGYKPAELKGKVIDLLVEYRPFTRSVENKTTGVRFDKTEWYPEVLDICFSGESFTEKDSKVPQVEEVL